MKEDFNLTDLKKLNNEQLDSLAQEIRQMIITTVSKNGGHLASNLGVVELTIAIHKVFDSPKDKIIFDVSHQSYTHKILTDRISQFKTLRKFKGLSGFTSYAESKHDAFEAGHSSTAISAGLGYLEAKKTFPEKIGEVIAIVGDASIVNGLSFEALNYLSNHKEQKMIIILNDNGMGISKNVGTLKTKKAIKTNLYDINLFTALGFQYFEKIDGHDFNELIKYLTYAKQATESVVLHVITKKGKGYAPAEEDLLGLWHGVGPFDIETGQFLENDKLTTFGEVIAKYLIEYTKTQENGRLLRVITPAMTLGSGLETFASNCPKQFIDVGLAEENATLLAASLAHAGLIPILFCYATFLQRAYDEIIHDIARTGEHVIICIDHAGIVSQDGDTHQGIFDLSYLNSIPGLTILSPSDASEALSMLKYSIEKCIGPVIIRYSKEKIANDFKITPYQPCWNLIGCGKVAVITYGVLYNEVKELMLKENLNITLVNASIISQLDEKVLENLIKKMTKIIVYEEVYYKGSLGDAILRFLNQKNLTANLKILAFKDTYLEVGSREELLKEYKISLNDLKKAIGD